jgi:hypothetical protein
VAKWVQCTAQAEGQPTIYVNVKLAAWIAPQGKGSRIAFAGADDVYVDVVEQPRDLIMKAPMNQ